MVYFTFTAGGKLFAINAMDIEMIVASICVKPKSPPLKNVRGVLEFGNEFVTVIDFNKVITGEACPKKMHARIAILNHDEKKLGILGEFATEVLESEKPFTVKKGHNIGDHFYIQTAVMYETAHVLLIDVPLFFKAFQNVIYE